jgi:hypothetical protein
MKCALDYIVVRDFIIPNKNKLFTASWPLLILNTLMNMNVNICILNISTSNSVWIISNCNIFNFRIKHTYIICTYLKQRIPSFHDIGQKTYRRFGMAKQFLG